MTTEQWKAFSQFRSDFKQQCETWSKLSAELYPLQLNAASKDTPPYPQETAVVYNQALDDLTQTDDIHLIVIGDNPGKEEQLAAKRRYLVGQSGRIAEGFFRRNPELNTGFRKNVIILNKTPVHTAKTSHLHYLMTNGSPEVKTLIIESQKWMAEATAKLHQALVKNGGKTELWLVGYAELKGEKGLFIQYRNCLKENYLSAVNSPETKVSELVPEWNSVYVYQHFSMNRFLVDLKNFRSTHTELSLTDALVQLGHLHRDEIFGK